MNGHRQGSEECGKVSWSSGAPLGRCQPQMGHWTKTAAWPQPGYVPLDQAGGSSNMADLNRTPHAAVIPPRNLGVNSVVVESSIQPGQGSAFQVSHKFFVVTTSSVRCGDVF